MTSLKAGSLRMRFATSARINKYKGQSPDYYLSNNHGLKAVIDATQLVGL
jgi:hypothetical protein